MANLKATVTAVIPAKATSGARVSSPPSIRGVPGRNILGAELSSSLAGDLDGLASSINQLQTALKVPQKLSQILLTNDAGEVTAAFGNVTYQGVVYTNFLSELHSGDPQQTHNPSKALFNANLDGSVTIGQNGWLDVLDPYAGNAAWIGTQFDTQTITGAADNGAGLIRLTIPSLTLITGNTAQVRNMNLYGVPNAVGTWTVTRIDATHVDLQGSVWAGTYAAPAPVAGIPTYLPTIDRILQISGATSHAGVIQIKTSIAHGYESGTKVNIPAPGPGGVPNAVGQWIISVPRTLAVTGAANNGAGLIRLTVPGHNFITGDRPQILNVGGVPNANGYFVLTVIDATHVDLQGSTFAGAYTAGGTITFLHANIFDLTGSTFAGAYTTGGTALQYFAGMLAQTVAIGDSFQDYKLRAFPSGDLRIRNATIELTAGTGTILLDPITAQLSLTSSASLAEILLDATVPSLTLFDQQGNPSVALEILTESPLNITAVPNATPVILTVPGNTYVSGDTIHIQGATTDSLINGYRLVVDVGTAGPGTFRITDLQGNNLAAPGAYSPTPTATRYYAGILAQTLALGSSFAAYKLRFFADGTLKINNASIDQSVITASSVNVTSFTSTTGVAPNVLTLTIANGVLTSSGTGTQAGNGTITIDGLMKAAGYAVGATLGVDDAVVISGLTLNFLKGIFTGQSGSFGTSGFSGTATVRNAAGTGTSSITFVNGLCTGYTP